MEYQYLLKVNSPEDLRKIPQEELPQVADEVRDFIIQCVSKIGGHLGASLGAVELCVALHYVFDTPRDRIVFDVGHQAYGHKILTGRRERFHTIRQYEGLAPFLYREESPYDVFGAGHACTAISSGLGIATARDLSQKDFRVVSVVGDGGLTGGLALEGLNQAGYLKKDLILVLNDNEMSIAPNVGALSGHLKRIVAGQPYLRLKKDIEQLMHHIPALGDRMYKTTKQIMDAIKTYAIPGLLIEELGFEYHGPINGHDVRSLVSHLKEIRDKKGPLLLHIITTKGRGYLPAEKDQVKWHGPSAFDVKTAAPLKALSKVPNYTSVFAKTLIRLAEEDEKIVAITAAMPGGTGLDKFAKAHPDRCFDVGIAEQHAVTFAAGMATEGYKPVCAIYSTFLQRAYDQIVHDTCVMDLRTTFCLDRAGFVGEDGPTHHGVFDSAYLRCLPNMCVMAPKDENEFQHMIKTAIEHPHPAAIRYPRGSALGVPMEEEFQPLPIGKGEVVREGSDLAIIAVGTMVDPCVHAAERLLKDGIGAHVVNARFIKPLDEELICQTARRFETLIFAEEAIIHGGFSSACWEVLEKHRLYKNLVLRIGVPDQFVAHGSRALLLAKYALDADGLYNRIIQFLQEIQWKKRDLTISSSKGELLQIVKKQQRSS